MNNKVIISGAGLVSSLGLTASETWDSLLSGKCGIRPIESFDAAGFDCHFAAQARGLDASGLDIHPRDSRIMDIHSYMLMKSSRDAFAQSRLDSSGVRPEEIGYFAGMGMVDYRVEDLLPAVLSSLDNDGSLNYEMFYSDAFQQIHPLWPLSMLNNINFCQVAIDLGIKGENSVFSPHADSGIHAIIEACNVVMEEKVKVALAGGVSEKVSPSSLARASWFGILNNDTPSSALTKESHPVMCAPFGKERRGTVPGEGSGIISLELASTAEKRAVQPLAAVIGYGASCEVGKSHSPTARAISLSMEQAMDKAQVIPSDIDLIMAHGDGTVIGDKHEMEAIHTIFRDCIEHIHVYSSKGALGHLLAGAAAVDVVLGIYILESGIIPAVYDAPLQEKETAFSLVTGKPLKAGPGRIMINSRSYEGQCASLIIEAVK